MLIHKVLLIDDDVDDCYLFSLLIKEVDPQLQVATCHQCEDAISCFQNTVPDLVFLDIHFPRMGGYDCIKMIRDHKAFRHLPIIVYTGTMLASVVSSSYSLGANLFLIKPNHPEVLKDSLKKILELNWNDSRAITAAHFKDGKYLPFSPAMHVA